MALVSFSALAITTSDYVIDEGTLVGDVNNDGTVTSVDVTALYNYLLNGDTSHLINGDVDGDGVVTSADVTSLYSYLLNGDDSTLINGDVDGDGHITSGDITTVYSIMLGQQVEE